MTPAPSRPRVAFVTHGGSPDLTADDRLAAAALEELGVAIEAVPWGQPAVDWLAYAAIVLRSTWDYHLKLGEFLLWVDRLDALDAPLWNPPPLLRWNCRKEYLLTITHPHLRPPPTHFVIPGATTSLAEVLDTRHWDEVVIKPSVSADALDTLLSSRARAEEDQAVFEGMLERTAVVVQPLVPEKSARRASCRWCSSTASSATRCGSSRSRASSACRSGSAAPSRRPRCPGRSSNGPASSSPRCRP